MIVVMSGEGPTDLGECNNGQGYCEAEQFDVGPLTVIIDQIAETVLDYSLLSVPGSYKYISRGYISEWSKADKARLKPTRGRYSPSEVGIYRQSAFVLASIAKKLSLEQDRPAVAVLFHDADGTGSSHLSHWKHKYDAMLAGFDLAGLNGKGVPMLPMPKSETWLICAAQENPYVNCAVLERLPGNDAAPRSPKDIFEEIRGKRETAESLCNWLTDTPYDHERACDMPSFAAFKEDIVEAIMQCVKKV